MKRLVKCKNLLSTFCLDSFLEVLFDGMIFVVCIISLHITTESPIILPTYLPFLQLHVAGFQI